MVVATRSLAALPFADYFAQREKYDSVALEMCLETVGLENVVHMQGKKIVEGSRMECSRRELVEAVHHNLEHGVVLEEGLVSCSSVVAEHDDHAADEAHELANFAVGCHQTWRWGMEEDLIRKEAEEVLHQHLENGYSDWESSWMASRAVVPCSVVGGSAAVQKVQASAVPSCKRCRRNFGVWASNPS
jgi:hypothetical protein